MDKEFVSLMKERLEALSVELSDLQIEQFYQYYQMVIEKNEVMNLTAITDRDEFITKHFVDSLSLTNATGHLGDFKGRLLDLGTGAGFPGIPLKIAFPNLKVTLADSLKKRVNFLVEVIEKLSLQDIDACNGRAEDLGHDHKFREQYDICVSRAVANLSTLSEYCLPFVKTGGRFISYKSGNVESEIEQAKIAISKLGGMLDRKSQFILPCSKVERSLILIKKVRKTPESFPRKAGLPGKNPIC